MIVFENVTKVFDGRPVIENLNLHIEKGNITVLIGASGSGKSTTLKMINRLIEHEAGRILFAGEEIRSFQIEDLRRRMGYAIQSIGLFPHWTVAQNIATVPQLLHWDKQRIEQRVDELLNMLNLEPSKYRDRYPHQLSGGQQQRIGVARAMAADPEILLMDEPFGALDPITRTVLQEELKRIHQLSGKTILLVTHDIDEALSLADHLVLMDQGKIIQEGRPAQLLADPANDFVRHFMGRSDLGVKILSLQTVQERFREGQSQLAVSLAISGNASLKEALSQFVAHGVEVLPVRDDNGQLIGELHFSDLLKRGAA